MQLLFLCISLYELQIDAMLSLIVPPTTPSAHPSMFLSIGGVLSIPASADPPLDRMHFLYTAVARCSYPVEWCAHMLPIVWRHLPLNKVSIYLPANAPDSSLMCLSPSPRTPPAPAPHLSRTFPGPLSRYLRRGTSPQHISRPPASQLRSK